LSSQTHIDGDVCEMIATEYFLRLGYWVFPAVQGSSPVDLVIVNADGVRLIQVKKDASRVNPGRKIASRIHRGRSDVQKALGVEMVYVNPDSRDVFVSGHHYHKKRKKMGAAHGEKTTPTSQGRVHGRCKL
jgi:hypothetical protein